ncbi:hypothetical protein [Enterobacter cloacae]|uniref:hypothetical protein n=1 Tax=Enterobacter cloacae TaxID=550 RepID=UPI0013D79A3C|nr:hypothetical protein [Enterobacter cloacae]
MELSLENIKAIINDDWLLMDDCEGNKNCNVVKELARIALASLEAEPVAFRSKLKPPSAIGSERWDYTDHRQPDGFELENCVIERLFTARPAAVSVPDESAVELLATDLMKRIDKITGERHSVATLSSLRVSIVEACRAAMLQGADGNSPVIPDGWVMVPIEPTEDMIVHGFESEPDESFSDDKEWAKYEAMSGCQQAAHRAKLCWAAMIAASPAYKKVNRQG